MISNLKSYAFLAGLVAMLLFAWVKPLDDLASQRVDEGFKRALVSFATARVLSAAFSVAQGTDFSMQPAGVGVKLAVGQVLRPISELLGQFAELMLTASIVFGVMKVLLIVGGSGEASLILTVAALGWGWSRWKHGESAEWLSRLLVVLLLVRFSVPIVMVGSDAVFQRFLADEYTASQRVISVSASQFDSESGAVAEPKASGGLLDRIKDWTSQKTEAVAEPKASGGLLDRVKDWTSQNLDATARIQKFKEASAQLIDHIVRVIVVFLMQTLVIPLLFFWALYRVLLVMFPRPIVGRVVEKVQTAIHTVSK